MKSTTTNFEKLQKSVRDFSAFCNKYAGENEDSVMEIIFNGEYSDLYATHFVGLLNKMESLAGCGRKKD